jgi:hypothetical protein
MADGDIDDDNVMHDSPVEFLSMMANSSGQCIVQSVLPDGDIYRCHCTCGNWDVIATSQDEGLKLAEAHTLETIGE